MKKSLLAKAIAPFSALALLFGVASHHSETTVSTRLNTYAGTAMPYAAPTLKNANYLAEMGESGYSIWSASTLPLKVYIEDGTGIPGYRESYQRFMRSAFSEWQTLSNQQITWKEVSSPDEANIVCNWTTEVKPRGIGVEAGQTETIIQRNPFTGAGRIVSARIKVLTSANGQTFNDVDAYKTCLHEVGHALGLQGHSSTASDIMYPVLNRQQTPYLKQRDVNTIAALYQPSTQNAMAQRVRPVRIKLSDLSPEQQMALLRMLQRMGGGQ
jgi:predicted Zn-dependent protease